MSASDSLQSSANPTAAAMLDDLRVHHGLSIKEVGRQARIPESALRKSRTTGVIEPTAEQMKRLTRMHRRYRQLPTSGLMPVG